MLPISLSSECQLDSSALPESNKGNICPSVESDILAQINQAECKTNCGFVAMQVFRYFEDKKFDPIKLGDFRQSAPLAALTVFGMLDDIYMGRKNLSLEHFTGQHDEMILSCEQRLLGLKQGEHAIVAFSYVVSEREKGHFINIYREKSSYQIIDAITVEAFHRYLPCRNLSDYFQVKLPRVNAAVLSKIQTIY